MSLPVPASADQPLPMDDKVARKVRALGWLLVVIGPCLSGGIAAIAFFLHDTIAHNNESGARSHWNGSPELTRTAFELFGAVFLFGLVAFVAGIFQVRSGRRNLWLVGLLLILVATMIYLGSKIVPMPTPP